MEKIASVFVTCLCLGCGASAPSPTGPSEAKRAAPAPLETTAARGAEAGGEATLAVTFQAGAPGVIRLTLSGPGDDVRAETIENPLGGCVLPSQTAAAIPSPPEPATADLSWRCRGRGVEHVYHLRVAPASIQVIRGVRPTEARPSGPEGVGELTYERVTEIPLPADIGVRITTR